ncbi:MAG: MFS transporter [Chloroflexota bacterium]
MIKQEQINKRSSLLNGHPPPSLLQIPQKAGFQLILLTLADLIARTAYQMGKTPLLPLYAATLGADELFLGFIASVSTMTGLVFKPLIGLLSDRHGRRLWLLIGTMFFIGMPFVYQFISSPEQLVVVRLIHGFATAIYGPVSMAMVVELAPDNRAARVGLFSLGRTGGYIFGPALAGFFLLTQAPVEVFSIIGFLSLFALVPVLLLPDHNGHANSKIEQDLAFWDQLKAGIGTAAMTPAIWLAGSFEAINYMVTYTAKAFLPIYALSVGRNVLEAGLFFTVQQTVTMIAKPSLSWIADRYRPLRVISLAALGLAIALIMLTFSANFVVFFGAAMLLGLAEALIIPASTAMIANQIESANTGAGLGFLGTLQNGSKIIGPIIAGFFITLIGYESTFQAMAFSIIAGCCMMGWSLRKA